VTSGTAPVRQCGAQLLHAHGTAFCDLPQGHEGSHGALCEACEDYGYTDPSDRLEWELDGENWLKPPATPA
jgi:hypothetical protein